MGKIKIHEIAKKLGLTSKEILEKAKSLNLNIKSHLSSVTDEEAKQLEEALKKKDKTEQKNKQNKKQPSSAIKKDEPVKDEKVVCLIQEGKWLQMEQRDSNNERMGNIHMKEPEQWDDLVNTIRTFVAEAKKQRKE